MAARTATRSPFAGSSSQRTHLLERAGPSGPARLLCSAEWTDDAASAPAAAEPYAAAAAAMSPADEKLWATLDPRRRDLLLLVRARSIGYLVLQGPRPVRPLAHRDGAQLPPDDADRLRRRRRPVPGRSSAIFVLLAVRASCRSSSASSPRSPPTSGEYYKLPAGDRVRASSPNRRGSVGARRAQAAAARPRRRAAGRAG